MSVKVYAPKSLEEPWEFELAYMEGIPRSNDTVKTDYGTFIVDRVEWTELLQDIFCYVPFLIPKDWGV